MVPRGHRTETVDGPVMTRAEDHSVWLRSAKFLEKYKLLVYIVTMFLIALGFDFRTPKQANAQLQSQIDTLRTQLETGMIEQREIRVTLDKLTKVPCLARDRNLRDLALIGITCPVFEK